METQKNRSTPVLPVYIALGILILFSVVFVIELARTSGTEPEGVIEEDALTADSYMGVVAALLADADPVRGEEVARLNGCMACHESGAANNLAPFFEGVGLRASERRPPLTAEAYLYESIIYPGAFEVPGYITQMPRSYANVLSEQDLGDVIAYLLTQTQSAIEDA